MKYSWLKVFTFSTLSCACLSNFACKQERQNTSVSKVEIAFKREGSLQLKKADSDSIITVLDIEIADDAYTTQTGLMYRNTMENHQGMLFIFPDSDYRSFYMKNTKIPLDIIYISEDKQIVSIQKNTTPMDETSLPSEAPAKYVLEVNAGRSDSWNLTKGDLVEFQTN